MPQPDPTPSRAYRSERRGYKDLLGRRVLVVAVVVTVIPPAPSSVLFAVAGQVAFAALALLGAAVLLLRRGHFESDRGFDTTPRFAARRLR